MSFNNRVFRNCLIQIPIVLLLIKISKSFTIQPVTQKRLSPSFTPPYQLALVDIQLLFHDWQSHILTLSSWIPHNTTPTIMTDNSTLDNLFPVSKLTNPTATSVIGTPFGLLEPPIKSFLTNIHKSYTSLGITPNWGLSILTLTIIFKLITFPLNQYQFHSNVQYKKNVKYLDLQQQHYINPYKVIVPSLIQFPLFLGLYRAIMTLVQTNMLKEPFAWIPQLQGPQGCYPSHARDWIWDGSLSWGEYISYMSLPVILVLWQFITIEVLELNKNNEKEKNTEKILNKILPLIMGWMAIKIPPAVDLYWIMCNILSLGTTMYMKSMSEREK